VPARDLQLQIDGCRQAQKKRRIASIVVSRNQSVFQRLMLLEYQKVPDLASGMVLMDVGEWVNRCIFRWI
jgi:hypothetical protein